MWVIICAAQKRCAVILSHIGKTEIHTVPRNDLCDAVSDFNAHDLFQQGRGQFSGNRENCV